MFHNDGVSEREGESGLRMIWLILPRPGLSSPTRHDKRVVTLVTYTTTSATAHLS